MIDPVLFTESLCELQKIKDEHLEENKHKIVTRYLLDVYKTWDILKDSDSDIKSFFMAIAVEKNKLK